MSQPFLYRTTGASQFREKYVVENREEADSLRNVSYVKQSDTSIMQRSRKKIPWGARIKETLFLPQRHAI